MYKMIAWEVIKMKMYCKKMNWFVMGRVNIAAIVKIR